MSALGKALMRRWSGVVLAAFIVAAPAAASADGPASATGAGHGGSGDDQRRTFSFTAVMLPDGSARGNAQLYARGFPAKVHMQVTCLRVQGNVAYISGLNTSADPAVFEGIFAIFAVEDNGEGSAVDRVTQFHPAAAQGPDACLTESPADFFPIEQGNVQVRA